MIIDTFMVHDELDMVECHLRELAGVVDRFIAVEASHTFSGRRKPYFLSENAERFRDFPLEIVRDEQKDPSRPATASNRDAWLREAHQRNAVAPLLKDVPGDTLLLYGDVDEIPNRETVLGFSGRPRTCLMNWLEYSTKLVVPKPWWGTVIGYRRDMGSMPEPVRRSRFDIIPTPNAGWHLSWFGEPDDRLRKLASFSHLELIDRIGTGIGTDYPSQRLHVEHGIHLLDADGMAMPAWIAEGKAPASWYRDYP